MSSATSTSAAPSAAIVAAVTDPVFRTALNSGYRRGATIDRTIRNQPATFKTFAPVVLAGIGPCHCRWRAAPLSSS